VIIGSVSAFAVLLLVEPTPWRSNEYIAIGVWSIPLGAIALLAARGARYFARRWGIVAAIATTPFLAFACALIWTFLVYAGTGMMILGTFDANPFWSWTVGALLGLLAALIWPVPTLLDPAAT
jgi:hypothetical protein